MKKLNLNQSLLLKSCFLNNGSDYFRKWLSIFNPSDLDYYTRAIISILLNSISIEKISPELNKKMIIYKQQTWFLNCRKWQKIKSILSDFTDAKIECCLLKGAAMVLFYYDDLSQRPENADIDILIKKENLTLAIEILKKHGFVPQKAFFWDANDLESQVLKQGSVLSKLHAIHYLKDGLVIDLHWNLSPIIKNITYEKLEKSMLSTNKFGIKLYYLCPEMQLVHLAIHSLFQDIKSKSINSTIDFCYLVNRKEINLSLLSFIANNLGLKWIFFSVFFKNKEFFSKKTYCEYINFFKSEKLLFYLVYLVRKRPVQLYYFISDSGYNPLIFFKEIKSYFGVKSYFDLILYVFKR